MSLTFFFVGAVIFAVYMYFTIWNIYYNSPERVKKRQYPNFGSEGCDLPENTKVKVQKTQTTIIENEVQDEEDFHQRSF